MPLHKSELIVLVARRRESALFLDVLRDWASLGLVADFLVVDADTSHGPQGHDCMAVSGESVTSGPLQATLAAHPSVTSAHVVCLSQVDEQFSGPGHEFGHAIFREVGDALPSAEVTWVHAISIAQPERWPDVAPEDLGWVGSHNVVLVPENSRAPSAGVAKVPASPITSVRLTQQAAALCSAVGLWTAERRTPFNGEPAAGGGQVVALRTFIRQLDTEPVLAPVVAKVLDVAKAYPIPSLQGRPVQRFEDQVGVATGLAHRLLAKHSSTVSARSRTMPSRAGLRSIDWLDALRLFLRFIGAVVARAPSRFAEALLSESQRRLASVAQSVLLGSEGSAQVVTVNGIRGLREDGSVATPDEYDSQLRAMIVGLNGHDGANSEHHDYAAFWKDFVGAACSLLDAQVRADDLDPGRIGSEQAVVTNSHLVVLPPSEAFVVAPEVQAVARVDRVSPYDADAARRTDDLLAEKAEEQRDRAGSLGKARTLLEEWAQKCQRSYAGVVGVALADEIAGVRQEIREYVDALQRMDAEGMVPPALIARQRRLAKILTIHLVVFLMMAGATVWIAMEDHLDWNRATAVLIVLGLLWLGTGAAIFHRQQDELLRLRQEFDYQAQLALAQRSNLGQAVEDLRRLQRLYRQYLAWSQALGTFIQAPRGYSDALGGAGLALGEGYANNLRFGVATPDEAALEDLANRLRPPLYPVGWLSRAWDAFRADVPPIGAAQHVLEDEPDLIFSDRSVADSSILEVWSDAVADRRWTGGAEAARQVIDEEIGRDVSHQKRLLNRVCTTNPDGSVREGPYEEFVEGLLDIGSGAVASRRFARWLFASPPQTNDPWTVAEAVTSHEGSGVPRSVIVTEWSRGFAPLDLTFCHAPAESSSEPTFGDSTRQPPQV